MGGASIVMRRVVRIACSFGCCKEGTTCMGAARVTNHQHYLEKLGLCQDTLG